MENLDPLPPRDRRTFADHDKPLIWPGGASPSPGRFKRAIEWLRRPTSWGMAMWKCIAVVMLGFPAMALTFVVVVSLIWSRNGAPTSGDRSHQTESDTRGARQLEVVSAGPWLQPLADYLHAGPRRKASECHEETYHRQCDPSFNGLALASVSFLHNHKGAWSVTLSPTDSSDFAPSRFGQVVKMCDRPGLSGFGAAYFRIVGGPLSGNFVTIQRSTEKPDGHQAIIKSTDYFRFAPSQFIGPAWAGCAMQAGVSLTQ